MLEARELSRLAVLAYVREVFQPNLQIEFYQRVAISNHSIASGPVAAMMSDICGEQRAWSCVHCWSTARICLRVFEQFGLKDF